MNIALHTYHISNRKIQVSIYKFKKYSSLVNLVYREINDNSNNFVGTIRLLHNILYLKPDIGYFLHTI